MGRFLRLKLLVRIANKKNTWNLPNLYPSSLSVISEDRIMTKNSTVRIKGKYVKNKGQGYTWQTTLDKNGIPIPFVLGVDSPESLPDHGRCPITGKFTRKDRK